MIIVFRFLWSFWIRNY